MALPLRKSAELMYFVLVIDLCRHDYDFDNTTLLIFSLSTLQYTRGTESGVEALNWCKSTAPSSEQTCTTEINNRCQMNLICLLCV